jgi:hypothetical protein
VHRQHAIPLRLGHVEQRREARDARAADEHVDGAEPGTRGAHRRPHGAGVGDVGRDGLRGDAGGDELLGDGPRGREIDVEERDRDTLTAEPVRDGAPDAGGAAGHERVSSCEPHRQGL